MKLNNSDSSDLIQKLRGIKKTSPEIKMKYHMDDDEIFHPLKTHNNIEIGPGMGGGQNGSPSPTAESLRYLIRAILKEILN